ncbi:MAG: HAD family hydrolase [Bacillota bacterium]
MAQYKNIIFDMDGVLVDSEPVIEAAAIAGLKEYGVEAEAEDFEPFIGKGEDRYIGGVAEKYGLEYKTEMKDRVYEIYLDIVEEEIKLYSGVKGVLERLEEEGFNLGLASSADLIKIKANLKVAGIPREKFAVILSADDVENTKPDPEIYEMAAQKLNADPENCLVLEDSLSGVEAARAAGMDCLGVTTSFSRQELQSAGANYVGEKVEDVFQVLG